MRLKFGANLPGPFFVVSGGKRPKREVPSAPETKDEAVSWLRRKGFWIGFVYIIILIVQPVFGLILGVCVAPVIWGAWKAIKWVNFKYTVTEDLRQEVK